MRWLIAIIAVEAIVEIWLESPLFEGARVWISGRHNLLDEFITCGWCLSVWVAIIAFALVYFGLWWLMIPIAIHRVSNYLHDVNGMIKRLGWRQ